MSTDAQTPFLGTPLVSPYIRVGGRTVRCLTGIGAAQVGGLDDGARFNGVASSAGSYALSSDARPVPALAHLRANTLRSVLDFSAASYTPQV